MPSNETTQLKTRSIYDLSGGMVTNWNYSKVQQNQVNGIYNGDLTTDGSIVTRFGRSKVNAVSYGAFTISSLMALGQTTGADLILVGLSDMTALTGTLITEGGILLKTLTSNASLMSAIMNEYGFFVNGVDVPFITDGTVFNTYQMGINQLSGVEYAGIAGLNVVFAGAVSTAGVHRWKVRYRSTITGARGNPCAANGTITIVAGDQFQFTVIAAGMSADSQVDTIDYFVQEAGAAVDAPYYYLGSSANALGVYVFDVSDAELMVLEVLDIDDNIAPAVLRDIENFKGRMVGVSGDYTVRYSKKRVDQNGVVNLPTSWPATNELNVGWGDGDPLIKVVKFNDYLFAMKRRSVWMLIGDFDSDAFEFKQLKTNITNVGLLNKRCAIQAGDSMFFISDDLKFHRFGMTDFSTTELRLQSPPPSDRVGNYFTSFASQFRQYVNLVNFTFAQYTQIWCSFTDGTNGTVANDNFSVFVYDYTSDNNKGAWHIHTNIEVASSVLARDADNNYYIFTGDYRGYLWRHDTSIGDGAALNFTGGVIAPTFLWSTTPVFTPAMDGCLVRCFSSTQAANQGIVRRFIYINADTATVDPGFPSGGDFGLYTIGAIPFEVISRDDWLDDEAPLDYDKQGWYLDLDVTSENYITPPPGGGNINYLHVYLFKNRTGYHVGHAKLFDFSGAVWGVGVWGVSRWPESVANNIQVGMNLFFSQIHHTISSKIAGQRVRVHGWTYHFQELGKVRSQ